jgi:hypothetical protein
MLTTGLICAPLILPTLDNVIAQPVHPNKKPFTARRIPALGISLVMGEPFPQKNITILNPIVSNKAVPINSDTSSGSIDFLSLKTVWLLIYRTATRPVHPV